MYRVQINLTKEGMWEYHIILDKNGFHITIGKGYRTNEHAARIDGAADMKFARSFGIGFNSI